MRGSHSDSSILWTFLWKSNQEYQRLRWTGPQMDVCVGWKTPYVWNSNYSGSFMDMMDMFFLVHTLSWVSLGSQESRSSLQLVSAVAGLWLGWKFLKCLEVDGKKEFIQQSFWEYVVISRYSWWDAVKNIISCVEKCIYCIHRFDISGSRNSNFSFIFESTNRRKITISTASRLQPCGWTMLHWRLKLVQRCGLVANPRGSEEMNFERSVKSQTKFDPRIGLIKTFNFESLMGRAQSWTFLRIFMRWASRLWLLWSAIQVLLGHPCTWLHQQLSVELAISLLGWKKHLDIIMTYLELQVSMILEVQRVECISVGQAATGWRIEVPQSEYFGFSKWLNWL